ncbi:hypothetical protein [Calothrix sp. PCC 6303]|uniref:hypothetical protein n=1 Tax=Calothrix sp. PCC 6303 TaxID=1170562 RepID=UPI0002A04680|nr:hypothetical protein [Calothrix sp. PCC 6303]AFZ03065.1 hypothetical protein Cal6303_4151 [Calothrix sp. PCC 6303]
MNQTNLSQNVIDCLQIILDAIAELNYDNFLTVGDENYQASITKDMFDLVSSQLAPRMSEGYTITYFGHIKQSGYHVYLWKLSFVDDGDEFLVRMAMNGNKVAGILIT